MNETVKSKIALLLRDAERIEYGEAELFLVGQEIMEQISALREVTDEEVAGRKKPPRDSLGRYVKPINPNRPAFKYTLYKRKTPRIITDPVKVRENLDRQLSIWKNVERKALREYIEREKIAGEKLAAVEKELNAKFEEADRDFDRIKNHYDEYEVFITNYETAKVYPAVYYSVKEEIKATRQGGRVLEPIKKAKKLNAHLSITVPNVLWYAPENTGRARSNSSVIEKLESGEYSVIGSSIYYKQSQGG